MSVTFHGVRGSTPCHGDDIVRYGGNTSCVSLVIPGEDPILFDLGTGLRYFGLGLPLDRPFSGTCLLSHLHWDHIQGLPFFKPLLDGGANLSLYAPAQQSGRDAAQIFSETVKPPLFPINFSEFPGNVEFHSVGDDEFAVGAAQVTSRFVPHVDSTLGYSVTWQGKSVTYLSDHQMPADGSCSFSPGAIDLCRGVDLLIHDAQYTTTEFADRDDWGHCTPEFAIRLASEAGVKRLALFHHDPSHSDDMLDEFLGEAIELADQLGVEAFASRERQTVTV